MAYNLTQGSIPRSIARFALPYLSSYLLQTLYGLVDLFLVGRFAGIADTTAVAIGSQLTHIFTVLTTALAMGTTVLIGRATGSGDKSHVRRIIINSAFLFAIFTVIATVSLLALSRPLISLMSTPEEARQKTHIYIVICFAFSCAIVAYNVIASILRGMGDSKSPLLFVAIASVANIILDVILIRVAQAGAAGAALGTVISQMLSVFAAILFIRRRTPHAPRNVSIHRPYKASPSNLVHPSPRPTLPLRPEWSVIRSLLVIGVPTATQDCFIQASFLAITAIANARGLTDAAAVGIVEKVISIMFLIPSSMLSTVSVMASQCIGARNISRARATLRTSIIICVVLGFSISAITMPLSLRIVHLFTSDDIVAIHGAQYLRSYVWDCVLAGVHFCFSGYFCAAGLSFLSFAHNAASVILVRVPLSYILSKRFPNTLLPMGMSPPLGSALSVVICAFAYLIITRKGLHD